MYARALPFATRNVSNIQMYISRGILCHSPIGSNVTPRLLSFFSSRVPSRDKRSPDKDQTTYVYVYVRRDQGGHELFAFTSYRINKRLIQTCFFGRGPRSVVTMLSIDESSGAEFLPSLEVHVSRARTARPRDRFLSPDAIQHSPSICCFSKRV